MLTRAKQLGPQLKSPAEIEKMRRAGRMASECLQWICEHVAPGITTQDLDDLQVAYCRQHRVKAAPLHYRGFPRSICTSVNEVICHGIPSRQAVLNEGDIVGVDVTLIVDGYYGDNAATIGVGAVSEDSARLLAITLASLKAGIETVKPGATLGDVGAAIQAVAEPAGYSVVRDFVGHGIGRDFHEAPQVPHYGRPGKGLLLRAGMTFTIEPMINAGHFGTRVLSDGWTAVTIDGKRSAQFEHTIAVTAEGCEILTCQNATGSWEPPGRQFAEV